MASCNVIRALALSLLVPSLALAQASSLNVITQVSVSGGTVEVEGSKRPHFTTFSMSDPTRLVIDVSDAVFSGVAPELRVGNGIISSIRTASYGSEASAIARIVVGFVREDAETDFKTVGNKIVISVVTPGEAAPRVASRPPVQADAGVADAGVADAGTSAETSAAEAARARESEALALRQAQQKAEQAARTEREAQVQAVAEAERAARADREAQVRAAAQSARAEREAQAQAQAEAERAQAAARAEAQARTEAERATAVRAEQDRVAAAARAARQAEEQRGLMAAREEAAKREAARAEAQRVKDLEAAARTRQEATRTEAARTEAARAEAARAEAARIEAARAEAARIEASRDAQSRAEAARAEAARAEVARAEAARAEAARAAQSRLAEEQARAADVARSQREAAAEQARRKQAQRGPVQEGAQLNPGASSGGPANASGTVAMVGFRQVKGVDRVYVRTDEPVAWRVREEGATTVVLELLRTDIGSRNNTLPLQTGFFETAVASVQASQVDGHTVRVRIQLDQVVPYRVTQEGRVVSVDFGAAAN